MTEQTFYHAVNQITEFLGAKDVPLHVKKAWTEKIKHIPDECVPYIVAKITDESDSMPRNLPKVFRERFLQWQSENPKKMAQEHRGCQDCEAGILFLERYGVTAAVFCVCNPATSGRVGRASLYEMQTKGWRNTKADKIGPASQCAVDKTHRHLAGAAEAEKHPDRLRADLYGEDWA